MLIRDQIGCSTFTAGIIYLTLHSHQQNRRSQAATLHSQAQILNSLLESKSKPLQMSESQKYLRDESNSFLQKFKIRWNEEIENVFWWIHSKESSEVRNEAEIGLIQLIGRKLLNRYEDTHDLKDHESTKIQDAFGSTKATTIESIERIKNQVSGMVREPIKTTTGIFADESYGSGKKIVDPGEKATYPALGEIKSGHKHTPPSQSASIEETLQKRYVASDNLSNSVEDTLNNRYKPIENVN